MKRYLIALDLDGTLMKSFSEYDQETFDYLKTLTKAGHLIVLATGRPYRSSRFIYDLLDLNTPLINYNGAIVHHPKDKNFPRYDLYIKKDQLVDILKHNQEGLINVFCEINDDIYVHRFNEEIEPDLHLEGGKLTVGPLDEILDGDPNGALVFVENDCAVQMARYIYQNYSQNLLVRFWPTELFNILEIYNKRTNKGAGLMRIANYYNIPKENIIAIGDGHNDIEMLQAAGIKVAMGDSHPELLNVANHHTLGCEENGVLVFLQNFFNNK